MEAILVINAGSSSLKFQAYSRAKTGDLQRLLKGQVDGIGTQPRLRATDPGKVVLIDQAYRQNDVPDLPAAMKMAAAWLGETMHFNVIAAGHRVVHGGPAYDRPVIVDSAVLVDLERYVSLAPLHQPNNLAPIRVLLERHPHIPQVACFDTAFHRGHSAVADCYALPERFYAEGIRRYGFHGLSYEYVAERLHQIASEIAAGRVIVAHLGSGASMCALSGGRSIETTMGFTALDGLPMGTRPGQIDPGVVLHLLTEKGMTSAEVQALFYRDCGLKGLSGISNDMRDLLASEDPRAAFAIDYFVYRVGLHAGMLAAALEGIDAFVFTAGIGENSAELRRRIVESLGWLGAELDPESNAAGGPLISDRGSRLPVYVVPTDEELMIARHTLSLLSRMDASSAADKQ